jgi:hypothetical protein
VKNLGLVAGERLDAARKGTAEAEQYIRSNDVGNMFGNMFGNMVSNIQSNLRQVIGRNPAGFLILAAGIGFLAGSAFT